MGEKVAYYTKIRITSLSLCLLHPQMQDAAVMGAYNAALDCTIGAVLGSITGEADGQ
jgi:hypothetical protein